MQISNGVKRIIKIILFGVGLLILFYLINRVGWRKVVEVISGAKAGFLFLGVLVYLTVIFTRSLKWFLLIKIIDNGITYRQLAPLYLVNSLLGNLTPFKSGELITPLFFKKYLKISVGQGFSVVILDRIVELIVFLLILAVAIVYILTLGIQNAVVLSVFKGVAIVLFLLLVIFVILIVSRKAALRIIRFFSFLKRFSLASKLLAAAERELAVFYRALELFRGRGVGWFLFPLSLLGWLLDMAAFYFVFSSVFAFPLLNVAVSEIVTTAATLSTFIPGGVGVAEVGVVYMMGLLGNSLVLAASGALLVRLFLTSTLLLSGLAGFLLIKKDLRRARSKSAKDSV